MKNKYDDTIIYIMYYWLFIYKVYCTARIPTLLQVVHTTNHQPRYLSLWSHGIASQSQVGTAYLGWHGREHVYIYI